MDELSIFFVAHEARLACELGLSNDRQVESRVRPLLAIDITEQDEPTALVLYCYTDDYGLPHCMVIDPVVFTTFRPLCSLRSLQGAHTSHGSSYNCRGLASIILYRHVRTCCHQLRLRQQGQQR